MFAFLPLVLLLSGDPGTPAASVDVEPGGVYVEARTASVYAGACHFGGEYTTQGRSAVMGWSFETGALAGLDVVVAVAADRNLAEPDAVRRSVVHVDAAVPEARRAQALAWLRSEHAGLLGTLEAVVATPVTVERDGDAFRLRAGPGIELSGAALPERECCRMAYNVWYEPLVPVTGRLVGNTRVFRAQLPAFGRSWSRPGENSAFFGRFGPSAGDVTE